MKCGRPKTKTFDRKEMRERDKNFYVTTILINSENCDFILCLNLYEKTTNLEAGYINHFPH